MIYQNDAEGSKVTLFEMPSGSMAISVEGCMVRILTLAEAEDMSQALDRWIKGQRSKAPAISPKEISTQWSPPAPISGERFESYHRRLVEDLQNHVNAILAAYRA